MTPTYLTRSLAESPRPLVTAIFLALLIATPALAAQASEKWSARVFHQAIAFDPGDAKGERLWVIGGSTHSAGAATGATNDVWSSTDGVEWELETDDAGWLPRTHFSVAVFDNKLWVLGGFGSNNDYRDDVWWTDDGINWEQAIPNGSHWTPRYKHSVAVFDDRMWVLGGVDSNFEVKDDIWWTEDGVNWEQVTPNGAHWSPRVDHTAAAFDNRLWVMGGDDSGFGQAAAPRNDVWSSADGITWVNETPQDNHHWEARFDHHVAVLDIDGGGERLWIVGGRLDTSVTGHVNDVWSSTNGTDWVDAGAAGHWPHRNGEALAVFDGYLWILGGFVFTAPPSGQNTNEVWASRDGAAWYESGAPIITSTPVTSVDAGDDYGYFVTITGFPIPTLAILNRPDWLAFDEDTGELSGTAPGHHHVTPTITITATSSLGEDSQSFVIVVGSPPETSPEFTSAPVTLVPTGMDYLYIAAVVGYPEPTLSVGSLPDWLQFNPGTGELFGLAPDQGLVTDEIEITASNGVGLPTVQAFTITVGTPPEITSSPVTTASTGFPYSYPVVAVGWPAPTFDAENLPDWLAIDPTTGELSGTAPMSILETGEITITASNSMGSDSQTFTIQVEFKSSVGGGAGGGGGCGLGSGPGVGWLALLPLLLWRTRRQQAPRRHDTARAARALDVKASKQP